MRKLRFLLAAPLLFCFGVSSASAAPASPKLIRETFALYVKAHPHAVVAVGIVNRGRTQTYYIRGALAQGRDDVRTRFQIGSITKVFTATVLAQMVQAGQVKLSDPIQPYLPRGVRAPSYHGKAITLLSLANHTSGLPGDPPNYQPGYSLEMLDAALTSARLARAPGSRWDYSNFGFAVLGQILARKAGLRYADLIKERILDPLDMRDTVVPPSQASTRDLGPTFSYGGDPAQPESFGALGPAGSMESDLNDMMKFLKANLAAPEGPLGRELAFAQAKRTPVPEWNMAMGLGWQTVAPQTHRVQNDLGDLEPGSIEKGGGTNGYASFIALNHAEDWGIVAWTNVNDDDFQQVVAHAVSPRTARMPVLWALIPREASPLSGTYRLSNGPPLMLDVFKYEGHMYLWVSNATPVELRPLGRDRYAYDPAHLTLAFHLNRGGRTTRLTAVQSGKTFHAERIR